MNDIAFSSVEKISTLGLGIAWLDTLRQTHLNTFRAQLLPSRHTTLWRYVDVGPLRQQSYHPPRQTKLDDKMINRIEAIKLPDAIYFVFINGTLQSPLSSKYTQLEGLVFKNFQTQLEENSVRTGLGHSLSIAESCFFQSMNQAYFNSGFLLSVAKNTQIASPIQLIFVTDSTKETQQMLLPHHLIHLAEKASCSLHMTYLDANDDTADFTNVVTHLQIDKAAHLTLSKQLETAKQATHIASTHATLSENAHLMYHTYAWQTGLSHDSITVHLEGQSAQATVYGTYNVKKNTQYQLNTRLLHDADDTESHTEVYGLADDAAKASFNGHILVHQDTKQIQAHLTNKNILLSEHAEINTEPNLEIYTDDIACSHGATVGSLDPEALFFLRTSGLDEKTSRALLIMGFLQNLFLKAPHPALATQLNERLAQSLGVPYDY